MTTHAPPATTSRRPRPRLLAILVYTLQSCLPPRRWAAVLAACAGAVLFGLLSPRHQRADRRPGVRQRRRRGRSSASSCRSPRSSSATPCSAPRSAAARSCSRGCRRRRSWQIVLGRWLGGSLVAVVDDRPGRARSPPSSPARRAAIGPIVLAARRRGGVVRRPVHRHRLPHPAHRGVVAGVRVPRRAPARRGPHRHRPALADVGVAGDLRRAARRPAAAARARGHPDGGGAVVRLLIVSPSRWPSPRGGCATCACPAPPTDALVAATGTNCATRMTFRTVIIGGDAAGMSAATRVRGRRVRTPRSSCSSGAASRATRRAASRSSSAASWPAASRRSSPASPEEHRAPRHRRAHHHEATAIDLDAGEVEFLDEHAGTIDRIGYDELLIATGGEPIRPDLPGIDLPFVHGVQIARRRPGAAVAGRARGAGGSSSSAAATSAWRWPRPTSSGAARRRSIERRPQPLRRRRRRLRCRGSPTRCARHGIDVRCGVDGRRASSPAPCSRRTAPVDADLVILGIGVRPAVRARPAPRASSSASRTPSASTSARRRRRRQSGRPATAPSRRTSSPASRCTSPSARTPTATAGSPASTWPAATPGRRAVLGTAITKLCALEIGLHRAAPRRGHRRRVRRRRHDDRHDDRRRLPPARRPR